CRQVGPHQGKPQLSRADRRGRRGVRSNAKATASPSATGTQTVASAAVLRFRSPGSATRRRLEFRLDAPIFRAANPRCRIHVAEKPMTETTTENAASTGGETRRFEAEVAQVLHLVTHSLYSNKDVVLRELISN